MIYKALFLNQSTRNFKVFFNLSAVKKKPFKRTRDVSYCPIKLSLAIKTEIRAVDSQSDLRIFFFSYDYRPNWTPLSPVTITNLSF